MEYTYDCVDDYDGDGHDLDMLNDYERQIAETYKVPELVSIFLLELGKAIDDGDIRNLRSLYENSYVELTERFYKTTPWPLLKDIANIVNNDEKFGILYNELYYKHLHARVSGRPNIAERFESYYNYCHLFNLILSADEPVQLALPNQWLWDIIDEFIYQFQNFSHYMLNKKTNEEIEQLRRHPKVWNVHDVLNVFHSLVDKSNIDRQLEVYTNGGDHDSVAGEFGRHPLYKVLGYFSLVGLLRLHSLLGDYYQAIKVLENIDLNKKSVYSHVPSCHITIYYYVGFSYLMMRRYSDAIRSFSNILLYIQRTQRILSEKRPYQADQMNKETKRLYTLLAICLVLHPQRINESILSTLKETYKEKLLKMQRGDPIEFEKSFLFGCPKFIFPVPPILNTPPNAAGPVSLLNAQNAHEEPFVAQLRVFMNEIQQQIMLPTIRRYIKSHTAMPIAKLAEFLDMNQQDVVTFLLCFKHKMKNMVWTKGTSGLEGEFQSGSEVDFFIDKDMIYRCQTPVVIAYGDYSIRHMPKFEEFDTLEFFKDDDSLSPFLKKYIFMGHEMDEKIRWNTRMMKDIVIAVKSRKKVLSNNASTGGGKKMADYVKVPFLGKILLNPEIDENHSQGIRNLVPSSSSADSSKLNISEKLKESSDTDFVKSILGEAENCIPVNSSFHKDVNNVPFSGQGFRLGSSSSIHPRSFLANIQQELASSRNNSSVLNSPLKRVQPSPPPNSLNLEVSKRRKV